MRSVIIDCFPESAGKYRSGYAVVVIDVIRATTTAVTALALGRRVFPARGSDDAAILAAGLERALLVGELGGNKPFGFDITNSPAEIAARTDIDRPMVLVSSSGTQLLMNAAGADAVYAACLRNVTALSAHLAASHERVAVIGAGTRGVFRREDQIGCAFVARQLIDAGYDAGTQATLDCLAQWNDAPIDVIREGRSADYLRKSNQHADLEFVLAHVDDLLTVPRLVDGELVDVGVTAGSQAPALTPGRSRR